MDKEEIKIRRAIELLNNQLLLNIERATALEIAIKSLEKELTKKNKN